MIIISYFIVSYYHMKLFCYDIITLLYDYNIILSHFPISMLNYSVIILLFYYITRIIFSVVFSETKPEGDPNSPPGNPREAKANRK